MLQNLVDATSLIDADTFLLVLVFTEFSSIFKHFLKILQNLRKNQHFSKISTFFEMFKISTQLTSPHILCLCSGRQPLHYVITTGIVYRFTMSFHLL